MNMQHISLLWTMIDEFQNDNNEILRFTQNRFVEKAFEAEDLIAMTEKATGIVIKDNTELASLLNVINALKEENEEWEKLISRYLTKEASMESLEYAKLLIQQSLSFKNQESILRDLIKDLEKNEDYELCVFVNDKIEHLRTVSGLSYEPITSVTPLDKHDCTW